MFQTLIPLDIIWMDPEGVIVEISADTPPCGSTNPADCPDYGGSVKSQSVLEMAGGQAVAHRLKVGDRIRFIDSRWAGLIPSKPVILRVHERATTTRAS